MEFAVARLNRPRGYHVNPAAAPEAFFRARPAVNTALSLAPDLANAHLERGWLLDMGDLDWRGAEGEYRRAFELAPGSGDAAASLARQLANSGHVDQAIALTQQALATDPLHSRWCGWLAGYLSAVNRLKEAEVAIRRAHTYCLPRSRHSWQADMGREDSFETAYCQTGFFRPKADLSLFRCPFSAVSTSSASIIIAYDP